jgi:asparagine synthase (glutamine-hydrolysing)
MCGLAGFIASTDALFCYDDVLNSMGKTILHRGPDQGAIYTERSQRVGLSHQRLAILDLTDAGSQPMKSKSGQYIIAFNGEIYNHLELRSLIEKKNTEISWVGHSDTETLLAAIELWGVEKSLQMCVGMFAFAVFDSFSSKLILARDRFGEKPLYYGSVNNSFVFGSELKAIKAFPGFNNKIDRIALGEYLHYTYVPAPKSIYQNIYKLLPGNFIEVSTNDFSDSGITQHEYWSLSEVVKKSNKQMVNNEDEACHNLEVLLEQSIKSQMLSDVPLGAFLSGGIDSSLISTLMQKNSMNPIKTFTIGFEDNNFNEAPYAKEIANFLGTDHSELYVSENETQEVIPMLGNMYDEPFADSSQIPTYLVCKAAKEHVTVALSGDAGDELFGGYNRYFWSPKIWKKVSWAPYRLRKILGRTIQSISAESWNKIGSLHQNFSKKNKVNNLGDKAIKLGRRLERVHTEEDLYLSLITEWSEPELLLRNFDQTNDLQKKPRDIFSSMYKSNQSELSMMFCDALTYLPDDILCKVDRAGMASSLETRVPFLDYRVAEYAWRLPLKMKIRDGQGKWILKEILYKHVPRNLLDRPKTGFGIPIGQWLRGPLKSWADDLLNPALIQAQGYFNSYIISELWNQHISGSHDWTTKLWTILMFQSWLVEQESYLQGDNKI